MKSFHTYEYIKPIMDEIKTDYYVVNDETVKKCFDCAFILQCKHNRGAYIIRTGTAGKSFTYFSQLTKTLFKKVLDYARYTATYDGENDDYYYTECARIHETIHDEILKIYGGLNNEK